MKITILLSLATLLAAQQYPPKMEGARAEVYKKAGDATLNLYIFEPSSEADKRPAIVFFFGGAWRNGTPQEFEQQCRYLASRGRVAITADYRVSTRHGTKANNSVRDATSAIRWVRRNAAPLRIDPLRIAAGGGSAGGHLAAAAGAIPGLDESSEDLRMSSRPNALVLFNPALVLAPVAGIGAGLGISSPELSGFDLAAISPFHHVKKGAPPTIIFHGKADTTVPFFTAELFAKKMTSRKNL